MVLSVERAARLLRLFEQHREIGAAQAAGVLGINRSNAFRLLETLAQHGLVVQNAARRFELGPLILQLASAYLRRLDLRVLARPHLEALREFAQESVNLYIRVGDRAVCIDKLDSPRAVRITSEVGVSLPLYAGSTPKVLLAYMPEDRREAIIERTALVRLGPRTITDRDALRERLAAIRAAGYDVSTEELDEGAISVAVPVFDYRGEVVAAVSVTGPLARFTPERKAVIIEKLKQAGELISGLLGFVRDGKGPQGSGAFGSTRG